MTDRAYTVAEIDRMRTAVEWMQSDGPYRPSERVHEIEERLRTYMLAGIDPQDLENQARKMVTERQRLTEWLTERAMARTRPLEACPDCGSIDPGHATPCGNRRTEPGTYRSAVRPD
jgi:hypothetical protein